MLSITKSAHNITSIIIISISHQADPARLILQYLSALVKLFRGRRESYRNDFFGEMITVSGLLTGQDLLAQLKGKPLGEKLLLPQNVLKSGETVFLDDMTLADLEKAFRSRSAPARASATK